jgi:hypothetical protein
MDHFPQAEVKPTILLFAWHRFGAALTAAGTNGIREHPGVLNVRCGNDYLADFIA